MNMLSPLLGMPLVLAVWDGTPARRREVFTPFVLLNRLLKSETRHINLQPLQPQLRKRKLSLPCPRNLLHVVMQCDKTL